MSKIRKRKVKANVRKVNDGSDRKVYITNRVVLIIIIALSAISFSNSLNNGFMVSWDDQLHVVNNSSIQKLTPESLKEIFIPNDQYLYHPLTMLVYAFEYSFIGLNPRGFHAVSLLFHLLNIILVFRLIILLTSKPAVALVVSLFFALHPMQVEAVAWISQLKDVLFAFFYLLSLISYLYYLNKENGRRYLLLSLLFFLFSLLSKPAAITLPAVLILIDYYMSRKFDLKCIYEKLPFFILAVALGIVPFLFQKSLGELQELALTFGFIDKFFLGCYAVVFYLIRFFVPLDLCSLYYLPEKSGGLLPYEYYASPLVIIVIAFFIYKNRTIRKELIFGSILFLVSVAPVLHIIPIGRIVAADRYTYLPFIGISFIIGQAYYLLKNRAPRYLNYLRVILIGYAVVFSVMIWNRSEVWNNGIRLFTDVIEKNPENGHGYAARAYARMQAGDYNGAVADYNRSIELNYDDAVVFLNRGNAKYNLNNLEEALADFSRAIEIDPGDAMAYYNRGSVIEKLYQDYERSVIDYSKAIELADDYTLAYNSRGLARYRLEDFQGAIEDYNKAIEISPDFPNAYANRGLVKYALQQHEQAILDYDVAIKLKPDYSLAIYNRGISRYYLKEFEAACNDWKRALELGYTKAESMIRGYCK